MAAREFRFSRRVLLPIRGRAASWCRRLSMQGVENIVFPSFVMGVPITNTYQWNNTLYLSESITKVIGTHTLKFGGQFHNDQVNENPNATFNGTFSFLGTETGNAFADFLLGLPSNYTQTTGPALLSAQSLRRGVCGGQLARAQQSDDQYGRALGCDRALEREIQQYPDDYSGQGSRCSIPTRCRAWWSRAIREYPAGCHRPSITILLPGIGMAYSPKFDNGLLRKTLRRIRKKQHSGQLWDLLYGVSGLERGRHVRGSSLWL